MTLVFSSPGSSPAGKRILAAGRAYQNRKVRLVRTAERQRQSAIDSMLREAREGARQAREAFMARAAEACAEQHYEIPHYPSMASIVADVSHRTGISIKDIMSARRTKRFIPARQESYWLCRELTMHAYPTIARFFHRDHTTILSGCRAHEKRMVREVPFS